MSLPQRSWPVVTIAVAVAAFGPAHAAKRDWDRASNIEMAAERLAGVQRSKGPIVAFKLVIDCYKTHTLMSSYTAGLESCIAQDFVFTQTMASVYSRLPPEAREQNGLPSPELMAKAMSNRMVSAFRQYEVPVKEAEALKELIEKHGLPAYAKIMFPKAKTKQEPEAPPE